MSSRFSPVEYSLEFPMETLVEHSGIFIGIPNGNTGLFVCLLEFNVSLSQ